MHTGHQPHLCQRGATQEAADALGSEPQLQLRTLHAGLHAMLAASRCLQFAVQYLLALHQLPAPGMPTLERVGDQEALAVAAAAAAASTTSAQGGASASSTASVSSTAPA